MTLYGIVRFLHVLFAIVAMGPHFVSVFMVRHLAKNPESAPALVPLLQRIMKFPKHGGMAMLLTGVIMVALHPAGWDLFKAPWLAGSFVLFLFCAIYAAVRVEPAAKELGAALATGPVKAEQVSALVGKINANLNPVTVGLLVIIILMVFRP